MQRIHKAVQPARRRGRKDQALPACRKAHAPPDRNMLLLTATPHHGDDDRFAHFMRLLDPDLFPEPQASAKAAEIRRDILRLGPDCPWALRRLKEDLRE